MANSSYTFAQVVSGTGFFSKSQDTGYAVGVRDLQTYLRNIGYTISDANGRFQSGTEAAVKSFQTELGITSDGSAGPATCLRLNTVRTSEYFNKYGKPKASSEWGRFNILAGNYEDVDLLARIIMAESGYGNLDDEAGVAIVLRNRYDSSNSDYWEDPNEYPNASKFARVVGNGHYGSANNEDTTDAITPRRGYYGSQTQGFIDPSWKNAVELAKKIVNATTISVTGYKVSGTTIQSGTLSVNSANNKRYLNQVSWSHYASECNNGNVDTSITPLTFSSSRSGNVIYKSK